MILINFIIKGIIQTYVHFIIILDHEFNKIGETFLEPPNSYNTRDMFIGKDGLYISSQNVYNPSINEDFMEFNLMVLRQLK